MAEPKYKKFHSLMVERNQDLFKKFAPIHDGFAKNEEKFATEFHAVGRDVLDVIRDWERRLCSGTEKGSYGQFSAKLSEKFWAEIKRHYPLVDQIGLIKKN